MRLGILNIVVKLYNILAALALFGINIYLLKENSFFYQKNDLKNFKKLLNDSLASVRFLSTLIIVFMLFYNLYIV